MPGDPPRTSTEHAAPAGKWKTVQPVGPSSYSATPIWRPGKAKRSSAPPPPATGTRAEVSFVSRGTGRELTPRFDTLGSGVRATTRPRRGSAGQGRESGGDVDAADAGAVHGTPVVVGGTVYVGDAAGNIYALDAQSGLPRWIARVGGPITASALVVGDVVLFGDLTGDLFGFISSTAQ